MNQKQTGPDVESFLGKLIYWCYRSGVTVELRNKVFEIPQFSGPHMVNETFERQRDGSLADLSRDYRTPANFPELVFHRGERRLSIVAQDWDSLIMRVEHEYRRIFMELSVPLWG